MPAASSLHDCIPGFAGDRPLDAVIHVGPADLRLLDRYLALWPARIAWFDADPEGVEALRAAATAVGATFHGRACCVDASAGERDWFQYDVAALDGPLELSAAGEALFPNLAPAARRVVEAESLERVLAAALGDAPDRVLLAIDLPGRERELIASLPPAALERVCGLLLRGCAEPPFSGGNAFDETLALLARASWRPVARSDRLALWPAAFVVFDEAHRDLLARVAVLEEEGARRAEALRQAAEAHAAQAGELARLQEEARGTAALESALQACRHEAEAERAAHVREQAAHVREQAALGRERESQARERAAFEQQRESQGRELAQARLRHDDQAAALRAADERIGRLEARLAEAEAARAAAAGEREAALRDGAVGQAHLAEAAARAEALRGDLARARDATANEVREATRALATQLQQVTAARDTALRDRAALVQQRERHVESLAQAQKLAQRQEGAATETATRQRVLEEALARADGQLALVRDLLLRD